MDGSETRGDGFPQRTDARKQVLRARLKRVREALDDVDRASMDARIARHVRMLAPYSDADTLLTYLSVGCEVDTYELIRTAWEDHKVVALPRCVPASREVTWHLVSSFDGLVCGAFGILEPRPETPAVAADACGRALAIVPGLAFDRRGYRLGYGGGFYDTFLSSFAGVSVGLCRTCTLHDDLAAVGVVETHDVPVDVVVTEHDVLECAPACG